KDNLSDPAYKPLSLRDIAISGIHHQAELSEDPRCASDVQTALRIMIEHKAAREQQRNLLLRIIEVSIDCFCNLFSGYGFTTTLSLVLQLCARLGRALIDAQS